MNQPGNKARWMIIAAALISAWPSLAFADIYVIINSTLTVGADDIKLIYTGNKELVGATKIKQQGAAAQCRPLRIVVDHETLLRRSDPARSQGHRR